jgi:hypothetical protein
MGYGTVKRPALALDSAEFHSIAHVQKYKQIRSFPVEFWLRDQHSRTL